MIRLLLAVLIVLLAAACQPATRQTDEIEPGRQPLSWPEFDYTTSAANGRNVYLLDTADSHIDIIARRDGPMARFGHDHVITVQAAQGYLQLDEPIDDSRADLRFDTRLMLVDDAEKRSVYGLDTDPDEEDVAATRRNMLDKVLKANQWPDIVLSLSDFRAEEGGYSASLNIRAGGGSHDSRQFFRLSRSGRDLIISGQTEILQSELGLEPFSILGGGLRVADALDIHFRLRARPLQ